MRELHKEEIEKRGCEFCADAMPPDNGGKGHVQRQCPHEKCPNHELDNVKSYKEYLKNANVDGLAKLLANLAKG